MIQLESDHGGVEVQDRSCTSFQLEDPSTKSKRKRKMADKDKKKKQVKKIKKEPVEGTETLLDKWLHSYKPSTIEFNKKVVVKTVEPEQESFIVVPLKGILKQTKCNSECKVDFYYFVKTKTILKDGKLSTRQKMRCLVDEEDAEKRDNVFKKQVNILDTLKKVNV